MKFKKIILLVIMFVLIAGCSKVDELSYDEILKSFSVQPQQANTFKKGFKFYVPKGLSVSNAGTNYVILSNNKDNYYLYIDLVSYNEDKDIVKNRKSNSVYYNKIKIDDKIGYIDINLWKNNKYLIEIMYNYAKIEVMVDKSLVNKTLLNSINILKSVSYNDDIIKNILEDDNLMYTEEIFDLFKETNNNSNYLDYENIEEKVEDEEKIKDTDFIN